MLWGCCHEWLCLWGCDDTAGLLSSVVGVECKLKGLGVVVILESDSWVWLVVDVTRKTSRLWNLILEMWGLGPGLTCSKGAGAILRCWHSPYISRHASMTQARLLCLGTVPRIMLSMRMQTAGGHDGSCFANRGKAHQAQAKQSSCCKSATYQDRASQARQDCCWLPGEFSHKH